ncbi:MAG: hypothetical protein ACYDC2_04225 [Solirubrobacteraceae bacterium]
MGRVSGGDESWMVPFNVFAVCVQVSVKVPLNGPLYVPFQVPVRVTAAGEAGGVGVAGGSVAATVGALLGAASVGVFVEELEAVGAGVFEELQAPTSVATANPVVKMRMDRFICSLPWVFRVSLRRTYGDA